MNVYNALDSDEINYFKHVWVVRDVKELYIVSSFLKKAKICFNFFNLRKLGTYE